MISAASRQSTPPNPTSSRHAEVSVANARPAIAAVRTTIPNIRMNSFTDHFRCVIAGSGLYCSGHGYATRYAHATKAAVAPMTATQAHASSKSFFMPRYLGGHVAKHCRVFDWHDNRTSFATARFIVEPALDEHREYESRHAREHSGALSAAAKLSGPVRAGLVGMQPVTRMSNRTIGFMAVSLARGCRC